MVWNFVIQIVISLVLTAISYALTALSGELGSSVDFTNDSFRI